MALGPTISPPPIESLRDGHGGAGHGPRRRKGGDDDHPNGGGGAAGGGGHADEAATDVTIAGLSAEKLTPEAEQVIETLLADMGRIRAELETTRRRLVEVEQAVDHHPFLPILSREAFHRQIAHVLSHLDRLGQPAGLMIFTVLNGDAIRRDFGLAARDRALRHVCDTIRAALGANDIFGSLTGNDLAVLLFPDATGGIEVRAGALAEAARAKPSLSGDRPIDLAVGCGWAGLDPAMSVEGAIAAADANVIAAIRR